MRVTVRVGVGVYQIQQPSSLSIIHKILIWVAAMRNHFLLWKQNTGHHTSPLSFVCWMTCWCCRKVLSRRVTLCLLWRALLSGSSRSGWRRQRQWEGWSRMLPGGGAEVVQHTFSLLERITELWSIGGKAEWSTQTRSEKCSITSREESWKAGF